MQKTGVMMILFILFIFHSKNSPNYNLSLKYNYWKCGGGESHCEINAFSSSCWHPIIATSFSQGNSSEFSPIMPEEFGEHLIRDQRPFLHPESLQILQIHISMMELLLFSSTQSFSEGFRSEDRDSHGKRLILCSVTHCCVYFVLLSWWKIQARPIIRFLTEVVRFRFFIYLLVFDRIHDAMHLNKMFMTFSRKTGPQH